MSDIPTYADDNLEERLKSFEKREKELSEKLEASEREKQDFQNRLAEIEGSLREAGEIPEKPEERVNRLAQDPDGYILNVVEEKVEPLTREIAKLRLEQKFDKAFRWLAKQEKVDADEIAGSDLEKELVRIVKDRGMGAMDPVEGTKAAYKIYQQEEKEREKREEERGKVINGNGTETVRTPHRNGSSRFTASQIRRMSPEDYEKNREAIREANANGLIDATR